MLERGSVLGVSIYISRRAVPVRQSSTVWHQPREHELFLCSLVVSSFVVRTVGLVQIEASQLVPLHIEAAALPQQLSHVCVRCRLPVPLSQAELVHVTATHDTDTMVRTESSIQGLPEPVLHAGGEPFSRATVVHKFETKIYA